ncbi:MULTISPECIES: hypothetical protein [unclassified Pseudoalteromonas]|uniref:hypothetical protein n=1 Tax=unclassified Pseudoalteromonas TaxID=194690 RepID=UPI0025B3DCBD|nr:MULTISPECIES: hypothetical protein [unclassified Pseudoalteromonas]MDN3380747.1 hypothetical protein [Pseudoalteromonas sp. APC 3893]MDN3389133.1 hypothetical protein [Pseudoalteromonas sp. APC 4017]
MTDLKKSLQTMVSDKDWEMMAKHAGMSAAEIKKHVIKAIEKDATKGMLNGFSESAGAIGEIDNITLGTLSKAKNECLTQDFEVSLFKIIGIKGTLTVCGSSTNDWTATLKVCLIVAGASVWCTQYTFDPHNISVCFSPSVGLAKADLCFRIEIHNNKVCLGLSGKACYWAFGWKCANFNETLFCIPL